MHWVSSGESVKKGEPTVLAIVETVLAVALYWWIAWYYDTHIHLLVSICVAPFLLLRSQKSTELGATWFLAYWRESANITFINSQIKYCIYVLIGLIVFIISSYFMAFGLNSVIYKMVSYDFETNRVDLMAKGLITLFFMNYVLISTLTGFFFCIAPGFGKISDDENFENMMQSIGIVFVRGILMFTLSYDAIHIDIQYFIHKTENDTSFLSFLLSNLLFLLLCYLGQLDYTL